MAAATSQPTPNLTKEFSSVHAEIELLKTDVRWQGQATGLVLWSHSWAGSLGAVRRSRLAWTWIFAHREFGSKVTQMCVIRP